MTDLTYTARSALVRPLLLDWIATLPESTAATRKTACPACGHELVLERASLPNGGVRVEASARCAAPFCVKLTTWGASERKR